MGSMRKIEDRPRPEKRREESVRVEGTIDDHTPNSTPLHPELHECVAPFGRVASKTQGKVVKDEGCWWMVDRPRTAPQRIEEEVIDDPVPPIFPSSPLDILRGSNNDRFPTPQVCHVTLERKEKLDSGQTRLTKRFTNPGGGRRASQRNASCNTCDNRFPTITVKRLHSLSSPPSSIPLQAALFDTRHE